jgi:hypothetical protein
MFLERAAGDLRGRVLAPGHEAGDRRRKAILCGIDDHLLGAAPLPAIRAGRIAPAAALRIE